MTIPPQDPFGPEPFPQERSTRTSAARLPDRSPRPAIAVATVLTAAIVVLAFPSTASAYIGPGAGFALVSSFFVILTTLVLALVALARWPFRVAWRMVRGTARRDARRRAAGGASGTDAAGAAPRARRLIVLGFDGQEPTLTDRWMKAGLLPHFAALAQAGAYHRLQTTFPPVSPVAWSSFSTGTNPGRHRIFDFLDRDRRSYLPRLSSTHIGRVDRVLRLGPYRIPLRRPELRLLRRSQPFWALLGEARVWSTVLRVPITFPPDRFFGAQLSAMAAPDLLGTQGTFTLFTTRPAGARFKEGGLRVPLTFAGDRAETRLAGPEHPFRTDARPLALSVRITCNRAAGTATIDLPGRRVTLAAGTLSEWIPLAFRVAPFVTIRGLCRMQLTEIGEHVSLYVSPISLDPEQPAMPISHPAYYATYLAKKIGPFSTLGLAEDTWALNEGVIDRQTFLQLAWDIDDERQRMCLAALDRLREGVLVCVFDATDRVQHMCWRELEAADADATHVTRATAAMAETSGTSATPGTPAAPTAPTAPAIEQQYRRNDAFLGQVMARVRDDDVVMVLSDHGFTAFRRGVNVNRWLLDGGYLVLKPGTDGTSEWLRDVDWSRTRAYALGLTGLFLNLQGRESQGIVQPGAEAARLKAELMAGLGGLVDSASGAGMVAIRELFDTAAIYDGPYVADAPDLLVGYNAGYRVSWDCASGVVAGPLFADNQKAWSGDHCVDPRLVPGVFLCSRPIARADPALIDIAPTALHLFGLDAPPHMEGSSLFAPGPATASATTAPAETTAAAPAATSRTASTASAPARRAATKPARKKGAR